MYNFGLTPNEKKAHLEKYNHALFTSMARCIDAVWELDINRETVFIMYDNINPDFSQTQCTFEDIRNKMYAETHPDYRDSVLLLIRPQYLQNLTDSISIETRTMIEDSYHQLRCTITPSFDIRGEVSVAYLAIQDLQPIIDGGKNTRPKQLDLNRYFSALNCGIIQYTRDTHRLVLVNDEALSLLGYNSMAEMQAAGFDGVSASVVEEDRLRLNDLISHLKSDDDYFDCEYRVIHRDGSLHICLGRVRMISDGSRNEPLIQRSIIDITQRVEDHNRLESAAYESKAKNSLLSSISHDLWVPLNAINGYTELAKTHITDTERALDYLNKVSISSRSLQNVISGVLDVSRIQADDITIEESEISLSDVLRSVHNMVQGKAMNNHISLDFSCDGMLFDTVICDRIHLNQVLLNLIEDAISYTSPGGTVGLTVSQSAGIKSGWCECVFTVWDTGRSATAVSGMGLAVTRTIIEKMRGTISTDTSRDQDSSVCIKLNLRISCKETVEDDAEDSMERIRNSRVLLVEDNMMNREIALVILEEAGAQVDVAEDGLQAVRKVEDCGSEPYDVVLMDIQMPIMDGYQAARAIREMDDRQKAGIPIVAMTANTSDEDRKKAYDAGMNAFLTKPIQIDSVFETIARILKKA